MEKLTPKLLDYKSATGIFPRLNMRKSTREKLRAGIYYSLAVVLFMLVYWIVKAGGA